MSARLLLATGNLGKQAELRALLAPFALAVCDLRDVAGGVDFLEEGDDYVANAVAKARVAAAASGWPALADDSGLEVRALGGAPGPRSARYGGAHLEAPERSARLLAELAACGAEASRAARFVCVVALALPTGALRVRQGVLEGRLLEAPRGAGGFGYDPIFEPARDAGDADAPPRSLAELGAEAKNRISHRARGVQALAPELAKLAETGAWGA